MMPADSSASGPSRTAPGAAMALLLLVLINLFNYIDRQVLAAVEPEIRKEFFPDVLNEATGKMEEPPNAKALMGWLNTAFLVTYMLLAPVFGALATRMSRWFLIAIGVIVWTVASGASGASEHLGVTLGGKSILLFGYFLPMAYLVMLFTRCFVGVGEAVYGPIAPDLIADMYPVEKRGQVMSWFYAAIPFGGALGYALGELMTKATGHWSYAFYAVVPPGLALGAWALFMKEPPRQRAEVAGQPARKPAWGDYAELFRVRSYLLNCIGMTFMSFAMGGLAFWAAGFLEYREKLGETVEVAGIGPKTIFGILLAGLGLAATIAGGLSGDWLRRYSSGAYFLVSGAAMILAAPLLVAMVYLPFPLAWLPLAGFVFCLFFNTGPTNTILANVIRPDLRARGFAVNILVIHLLGDAASPGLMGIIIGTANRYDLAFLMVAFVVFIGGIAWLSGSAFLKADTERASAGVSPTA